MLQNKIVTDGLVFEMDTQNLKSYIGPPLQNVANYYSASNGSGTGYAWVAGTQDSYIPGLQTTFYTYTCGVQNNYPTSGACCPNLFAYAAATTSGVAASTLYTYAILYKTNTGYTHPNFMYRYEYTSAGSYITEAGVFDTSKRMYLGDGWYWAWNTFTTQSTTARLYLYSFYYQYSTSSDKMYVAKVGVFPGDYTGMSPLLWPEVNNTRAASQCLFDLTGNSTLSVSSAGFDSNGGLTFNGSSNFINANSIPDSFWNAGSWTASVWVKFNAVSRAVDNAIFGHGAASGNNGLHLAERSSKVYFGFYGNDTAGNITLAANTWYNIVYVFNYSTKLKQIYVNGVFDNSGGSVGYGGTGSNTEFGRYPWATSYLLQGSLPIVNLYNKVLTAVEILQNYNATKSRFGL